MLFTAHYWPSITWSSSSTIRPSNTLATTFTDNNLSSYRTYRRSTWSLFSWRSPRTIFTLNKIIITSTTNISYSVKLLNKMEQLVSYYLRIHTGTQSLKGPLPYSKSISAPPKSTYKWCDVYNNSTACWTRSLTNDGGPGGPGGPGCPAWPVSPTSPYWETIWLVFMIHLLMSYPLSCSSCKTGYSWRPRRSLQTIMIMRS